MSTEICVRAFILTGALYCLLWSAKGPRAVAKGEVSPPSLYLTFVFFAMLVQVGYMCKFFSGVNNPELTTLLLTLPSIMILVGIVGHHSGASLKATEFYALYDALPEALAIAELARLDPGAAKTIAEECWSLVGAAIRDGEKISG